MVYVVCRWCDAIANLRLQIKDSKSNGLKISKPNTDIWSASLIVQRVERMDLIKLKTTKCHDEMSSYIKQMSNTVEGLKNILKTRAVQMTRQATRALLDHKEPLPLKNSSINVS